jgi:hypothetical protein
MTKYVLATSLLLATVLASQACAEGSPDFMSSKRMMKATTRRLLQDVEECLLETKPCRQACRDKDYAGGRCVSLGAMEVCICKNPRPKLSTLKHKDLRPECAKCSLPASKGGCANGCNNNCECQTTTDKCRKCFLKHSEGGCADGCDFDCNCN